MAAFLDVCRFNPTLGGTTDWTVSSAVTGYLTPASAGAVNGTVYRYRAESADLTQWEVGFGAYTVSGTVLARTTVLFNSLGTTAKISFSAAPQVAIVALKEDLISIEEANAFTSTQKDQAGKNLGLVRAIRVQKFTASGTYTPDANLLYALIECLGGGAGSGGLANSAAGQGFSSGAGGAGSYSSKIASASAIGAPQAVTVGAAGAFGSAVGPTSGGAGGDTSVGTLCVGKGASGGIGGPNGPGGAGGAAGTGDVTGTGDPGDAGTNQGIITITTRGGKGGSTRWGGGGPSVVSAGSATAGGIATGFGSGGGAPASQNAAGAANGQPGQPGLVIITEYCAA